MLYTPNLVLLCTQIKDIQGKARNTKFSLGNFMEKQILWSSSLQRCAGGFVHENKSRDGRIILKWNIKICGNNERYLGGSGKLCDDNK
jgi:hypothetical protein